jgi:serine protease Do
MTQLRSIVILAIVMIMASGCEANGNEKTDKAEPASSPAPDNSLYAKASGEAENPTAEETITESRRNAITRAVETCSEAIVGINVTAVYQVKYRHPIYDDPMFRYFFGDRGRRRVREYEVRGLGSGFLISPDGYILTNHHVAGNASEVVVTMTNGEKYDAEIIGSDFVTDVALLKIEGEDLPYLKLSDSDNLLTGEWVIAFGNPFGLFDMNAKPTVTVGVISNKGLNFIHEEKNKFRVYRGMIQTDAAISSGNSGGPLVNSRGEVIGMNTVIFSTSQSRQGAGSIGIGFAIPINRVKNVVDRLREHKSIDRNYYTGMEVSEITDRIADYLNVDKNSGVVVTSVYRNTPAERAGFEPGDIIYSIDRERIHKLEDYYVIINDGIVGQRLNFVVLRNDEKIRKTLELESKEN